MMARRILVVTTATAPREEVEAIVRAHAGEDAEVHVVAPASKISRLDRLTNAEDDARADAANRAARLRRRYQAPTASRTLGTQTSCRRSKTRCGCSPPTRSSC
jgi:hypothetical protein